MGCGEQARSLWDEPPPERNEREQNEVRSFDSSSSGHSRSGSDPHNGRVKRRLRTRGSKSPRKNRDGDGDGVSARANREGPAHRTRTKSVHAPRNARASDATYPCSRSAWRALEPGGCARSGRTDSEVLRVLRRHAVHAADRLRVPSEALGPAVSCGKRGLMGANSGFRALSWAFFHGATTLGGMRNAPFLNNPNTQPVLISQVQPGFHLAVDVGQGPQLFVVDKIDLISTRDDQGNLTNKFRLTSTKTGGGVGAPWVVEVPDGQMMVRVLPLT